MKIPKQHLQNKTISKIDDAYIDNNYPIIQEQILKAGIRLSSVLEEIFK